MRARGIATALLATGLTARSETANYTIAPGPDTALELKVDKTGLLRGKSHLIVFEQFGGDVIYHPQEISRSSVRLTIRSASAVCRDSWLGSKDQKKVEEYARKDMLDAAAHPEIRFESTSVRETAPARYDVSGTLTIRGIAKPVTVRVETQPAPAGGLSVRGVAVIRLTDYGLKPPSAALGTIGTKDAMELRFRLSMRGSEETN